MINRILSINYLLNPQEITYLERRIKLLDNSLRNIEWMRIKEDEVETLKNCRSFLQKAHIYLTLPSQNGIINGYIKYEEGILFSNAIRYISKALKDYLPLIGYQIGSGFKMTDSKKKLAYDVIANCMKDVQENKLNDWLDLMIEKEIGED